MQIWNGPESVILFQGHRPTIWLLPSNSQHHFTPKSSYYTNFWFLSCIMQIWNGPQYVILFQGYRPTIWLLPSNSQHHFTPFNRYITQIFDFCHVLCKFGMDRNPLSGHRVTVHRFHYFYRTRSPILPFDQHYWYFVNFAFYSWITVTWNGLHDLKITFLGSQASVYY